VGQNVAGKPVWCILRLQNSKFISYRDTPLYFFLKKLHCKELPANPAMQLLYTAITGYYTKQAKMLPEQTNFERLYLLWKNLLATPCHKILTGGSGAQAPSGKHCNVKNL